MQIPGVNSTLTVQPAEAHQGARLLAQPSNDSTRSTLTSMDEAAGSEGCCSRLFSCIGSLVSGLWNWITSWCSKPADVLVDKLTPLARAKSSLKFLIQAEFSRIGQKAQIIISKGNIPVWNHPTLFSLDILDTVKALPLNVMTAENVTIEIVICNPHEGKADLLIINASERSIGSGSTGSSSCSLKFPAEIEEFFALQYEGPEAAGVRKQLVEYFTA